MLAVCCCVVLVGCGDTKEKLSTFYATYDDEKSNKIEAILEQEKDIEHANVIFIEDKILVAMQVKPWLRYKKKKIEKKVEEDLKKEFPTADLIVSSDFKLHWESTKLIDENDKEKLNDEVDQLKKLSKEET